MKLLLVFTENYASGGANRYLIDSVNGVSRLFDKVVIVSNRGGLFREDLDRLNCEVSLYEIKIADRAYSFKFLEYLPNYFKAIIISALKPFDPLSFIINIVKFSFLLRKLKPTAVLACNGGYPAAYSTLAMILASRIMNISCALSIVSLPRDRSRLLYTYAYILDYLVCRAVSVIIVNSHATKRALLQLRGFPDNKISVVYNGLEVKQMSQHERKSKTEGLIIGCVARMDREKGVLFLLEAFAVLVSKYHNIKLTLVGNGDVSEELSMRIDELGLQEQVKLTGYYNGDINELLLSFDIYAFPSLWEGFPYSILEAMRAGCSIVATNVGGIPEAVRNREEALLVPPSSVEALESAIEELISDDDLRNMLGKNARNRFSDMFTIEKMNQRLQEVLST